MWLKLALLFTGKYTIYILLGILYQDILDIKFRFSFIELLQLSLESVPLFIYWAICMVSTIPFSYELETLDSRRKIFHLLALLLFVPAYTLNNLLLQYGMITAFILFCIVEYCRLYTRLGPTINSLMIGYLDSKDNKDTIVLSHFYLLVGCSIPVFLDSSNSLAGLAGVFSLGIGDASASTIGIRYGTLRLGSRKSLQGALAFIVSLFLSMLLFDVFGPLDDYLGRTAFEIADFASDCILTGLLEAHCSGNDNLVVPLYFYAILKNKI